MDLAMAIVPTMRDKHLIFNANPIFDQGQGRMHWKKWGKNANCNVRDRMIAMISSNFALPPFHLTLMISTKIKENEI